MKMKNMLIGGMSLALVACLSVGATLAYFTDSDEEVVNTFQFVTDGDGDGKYITVTLTEDDPQETITNNPKYGDAKATDVYKRQPRRRAVCTSRRYSALVSSRSRQQNICRWMRSGRSRS